MNKMYLGVFHVVANLLNLLCCVLDWCTHLVNSYPETSPEIPMFKKIIKNKLKD